MMVRGKKSPKSIAGALAITVMSLCVIYMASQEAAPEDVKYMPSVSDIVPGFNLDDSSDGDSSDDDDSSSSASKSSGDDADDFMSGLLGTARMMMIPAAPPANRPVMTRMTSCPASWVTAQAMTAPPVLRPATTKTILPT